MPLLAFCGAATCITVPLALSGCTTTTALVSSTSTATLTVPVNSVKKTFTSVANFGDSITCGYYAVPADGAGSIYSTQGYASLFDSSLGLTGANHCRAGDEAADVAYLQVYPYTTPALTDHQLYTLMIGTNDSNACGASSACLANYLKSLGASLAWLALPSKDKVLASDVTSRVGSWTPDAGFGLQTAISGASLSFSVQQVIAGRYLYVAYRVFDSSVLQAGSAGLQLDGTDVQVLAASQPSHPIATQNGTTQTIFLERVPLGAVGKHTITITTNSVGTFSFLWAGVSTADYALIDGSPQVLLGAIPTCASADLGVIESLYNQQLVNLASSFIADGLDIRVVPTVLDASADLVDMVHPNNGGHHKLAAEFASGVQ